MKPSHLPLFIIYFRGQLRFQISTLEQKESSTHAILGTFCPPISVPQCNVLHFMDITSAKMIHKCQKSNFFHPLCGFQVFQIAYVILKAANSPRPGKHSAS